MKLRFVFLILLLGMISQSAHSQTTEKDTFRNAVGINSSFINNFLPLDNPVGIAGGFLLHYIQYGDKNTFVKHAFDFDLAGSIENNESQVDQNNASVFIDYHVAKGKTYSPFKNAILLYGPEVGIDYNLNLRANVDPENPDGDDFNTNLDQDWGLSIGPMVGFGYTINKRLSIYTEARAYLRLSYTIDNFTSDSNPTSDFNDRRVSVRTSYFFPRTIVLFYHF